MPWRLTEFLAAFLAISIVNVPAFAITPSDENPTLTVTRYLGDSQINQFVYKLAPLKETSAEEMHVNNSESCDELLSEQSAAGLAKTKLPDDLRQTYIQLSKRVQGITFLEVLDHVSRVTPNPDETRYQTLNAQHVSRDKSKMRTAIAWVVANVFPYAQGGYKTQLPWQMEDIFKNDQPKILNTKTAIGGRSVHSVLSPKPYEQSMDFEFGRLNQFENGHGQWIYPSLGLNALTQVIAAGANPLTSHIYLHSASPINTRLYKMSLKINPIFEREENGVKHALFKVPLTSYLEAFPPSSVSKLLESLKDVLPGLKEWQIAFVAKEYYDLAEFVQDTTLVQNPTRRIPIRVRVWSKAYKRHALKILLDQFHVSAGAQAQVAKIFESQHMSPIDGDNMSSLSSMKDFFMQFTLAEGEHIQFDIPDFMIEQNNANPQSMIEFLAQSYLVLLRLPSDRYHPNEPLDERNILLDNYKYLIDHKIKVVFTTEHPEFMQILQILGAKPIESNSQSPKKYFAFEGDRLINLLLHMKNEMPNRVLTEFGLLGGQIDFQYTQRRMAY